MHQSLSKTTASATLHCLTGCAIGEILGMVISTSLNWSAISSIVVSVGLAFLFGYGLSMRPILKNGVSFKKAAQIALAADTISIMVMELADNGFILFVPGAISAGLNTLLFWISLIFSLAIAYLVAFPVNRWLIGKGRGHAIAHSYHHSQGDH